MGCNSSASFFTETVRLIKTFGTVMRKFCHASESIADSPPGKIIFYKPVRNFNTRHYISATKVNSDFTLIFDFGKKE